MSAAPNAEHWQRFRRLMAWTLALSLVCVGIAAWWMHTQGVVLRLHFMIAMALGIVLSLMLGAGLMGLVFFSARTGIDDGVADLSDGVGGEREPPTR